MTEKILLKKKNCRQKEVSNHPILGLPSSNPIAIPEQDKLLKSEIIFQKNSIREFFLLLLLLKY